MHAIVPQLLLYFPATHAEQEAPPRDEARPPGQAVHAPKPVLFLNVCLAQAVHGPPFGPGYPVSHMQFVTRILAVTSEVEDSGQAMQATLPVPGL